VSNPYAPDSDDLEALLRIGAIKLERTAGIPTWEAQPGSRHQKTLFSTRRFISVTDCVMSSSSIPMLSASPTTRSPASRRW
jgi:hypothetical protein